jgi:phosphoribosyl 1,2-cyclic phosphodiesterase
MKIEVFASSSVGNCYSISNGREVLLIECGIPVKKIKQAMGFTLSSAVGCLCSHNHGDHAKAAKDVAAAGVDLYTSQGTIDALGLTGHRVHTIKARQTVQIGPFQVMPFETIHDAAEPLGFLIASGGAKLLFATDTAFLPYKFPNLTHLMIECNYQVDILARNVASGEVTMAQKERLLFSHSSLGNTLQFLANQDLSQVREIHLLHLSAGNSDAATMKRAVMAATGRPVYIAKEK